MREIEKNPSQKKILRGVFVSIILVLLTWLVLDTLLCENSGQRGMIEEKASHWTLPVFTREGEVQQIIPTGAMNRGAIISYNSTNNEVATVDEKGNITAQGPGQADIIIEVKLNGETVYHTVGVSCVW